MKTVLLLGSNGFIGSNLKAYFLKKKGFRVICPTRKECNLLNFFQTKLVIEQIQPNYIINAAYIGVNSSIKYSNSYVFNNLKIVTNILRAAKKVKVLKKVLFFGSSLEYGDSKKLIHEELPSKPKNIYAATKSLGTILALSLARELRIPLVILRPFNLYGKHDNKSVIYYVISSILKNSQFQITKGEQIRDYLYIEDFVNIIYQVIKKSDSFENYQIYNIASGKQVTLSTIFNTIFSLMSYKRIPQTKKYNTNEYMTQIADIRKLEKIIKLDHLTPFNQGLLKTISWVKSIDSTK